MTEGVQEFDRVRPTIVGIAGGSASGKTTFSAVLTAALETSEQAKRVETLHTDRYTVADRTAGPSFLFSGTGEWTFDMNHPDAYDWPRILADMEARLTAEDSPDVLIVEGLMVLYQESLRECLDLGLFLELDADERAMRRMLRDMAGGRTFQDPKLISAYYLESARVGHMRYVEPSRAHADLILRGDGDFERLARIVMSVIVGC